MVTFNAKKEKPSSPSSVKHETSSSNPLGVILGGNPNSKTKEDLIAGQKLIAEWLSPKHLHMKTSLNQNQINSICILMGLAKQFKIRPLMMLLTNFIMYMISKGESSANQLVSILQSKGLLDSSEMDVLSKFATR